MGLWQFMVGTECEEVGLIIGFPHVGKIGVLMNGAHLRILLGSILMGYTQPPHLISPISCFIIDPNRT